MLQRSSEYEKFIMLEMIFVGCNQVRFPLFSCSNSNDLKRALKFPIPNPSWLNR